MRLGKVQASGYISDAAEEEVTQESATLASVTPEPVSAQAAEREQVSATG
jgi:hypothetical protein